MPTSGLTYLPSYHPQREPQTSFFWVCVFSIISNPLHTARRAMEAACCCPRGQQQVFSPPIETEIPVPNHCGSYWGTPFSYYPNPPNKGKKGRQRWRKEKDKGKQQKRKQPKAGPARPPRPLSSGPPPRPSSALALPAGTLHPHPRAP